MHHLSIPTINQCLCHLSIIRRPIIACMECIHQMHRSLRLRHGVLLLHLPMQAGKGMQTGMVIRLSIRHLTNQS
jgi:hypothetical protein